MIIHDVCLASLTELVINQSEEKVQTGSLFPGLRLALLSLLPVGYFCQHLSGASNITIFPFSLQIGLVSSPLLTQLYK